MNLPSFGNIPTKTYRRLLSATFLITMIGMVSSPAPLWADWVATCDYRGVAQLGNQIATDHFATQAECQAAISAQSYQTGRCNCAESGSSSSGSSTAPSGGGDMNSAMQSAYKLGEAIGDQIRADDAAAKARADELERERVERERQAAEERRLKYEASKTELLNNLRDSAPDSGDGLREVGSSGDDSGLRDVGDDGTSSPPKTHHKVHSPAPVDLRAWKSSGDDGLTPDLTPEQIAQFRKRQALLNVEGDALGKADENYDNMTAAQQAKLLRDYKAYDEKVARLYDDLSRDRLRAEGESPEAIEKYIKGLNQFADPHPGIPAKLDPNVYSKTLNPDPNELVSLEAASKKGQGSNQVAAGLQSHYDCGIFALSNAAETPYGITTAVAMEKVRTDYSLPDNIRNNPTLQVEKGAGGLNSMELFQTANAMGKVKEVDAKDIPSALAQSQRPVVVGLANSHYVAISRTFQKDGEDYYQVMDSNAKKTNGISYWKRSDLESAMETDGMQITPREGTVPQMLGSTGK